VVISIDPSRTSEWVHSSDRGLPQGEQTVWILRGLDGREQHALMMASAKGGEGGAAERLGAEALSAAVRYGIVGWRNWKRPGGEEIPSPKKAAGEVALPLLPLFVQQELALEVLRLTTLSPVDRGNSDSPLTSSSGTGAA
jgi:hypothetical protein